MAEAFMMQSLKGSSCTVKNTRQYFAIFRELFHAGTSFFSHWQVLEATAENLAFFGQVCGRYQHSLGLRCSCC
jgi:hypothetical protein